MITFCIVVGMMVFAGFAAWWLFRPLKADPANRQDLLEQLEAIDAEILDLYDERADVVQSLRNLGHVGRA